MEQIEIREQHHIGLAVCTALLGIVAGAVTELWFLIPVGLSMGGLVLWSERKHYLYRTDGILVGKNRHISWPDVIQAGVLRNSENPGEQMLILTLKGGLPREKDELYRDWIAKNRRLGAHRCLLIQRHREDLESLILCCYGPLDFNK